MSGSRIRLIQQAEESDVLAEQFERYARQLSQVFTQIPTTQDESGEIWAGPAAGRFTAQARTLAHGLDELRDSCTITARNLRRRAEHLRAEAARM